MNRGFFNSSWAKSPTWYNLAKFSMADDSQAEKVTHWNGLSISAKVILARDTNDATYLMLALGKEENYLVREAAAGNGNATPEVLLKALRDRHPDVRTAAAWNWSATPEFLMAALQNDDPNVRRSAAGNRKATPEVLLKAVALEGEENVNVRRAAAGNGSATPEVLLKALEDYALDVRSGAARNRKATPEVLLKALALQDEEYVSVRHAAAENERATPEVLMKAVVDLHPYVRIAAARNGNATPEVLLKALALEGGENVNVRRAAAWNGKATPEVLMKALQDDQPEVRTAAARNKNATAAVKTKYVLRYYLENGRFPESSLITPAAINALVRDQRVDLERLGGQIESSPFRNNEYIRASIQLEKKRREKQ
jgi:HEAT repeat protein